MWWRRISREAEKLKAKKAKVGRVKVKGERVIVDRVCLAGRGEQTEGGGKGWCSNQRKNTILVRGKVHIHTKFYAKVHKIPRHPWLTMMEYILPYILEKYGVDATTVRIV